MSDGSTVVLRALGEDDVDAVVDEFDRTWGGSKAPVSPGESLALSRHFVLHFLEHATRADVAVLDGVVVGAIVTRIEGKPGIFPWVAERMERTDAALDASSVAARAELRKARRWHVLDKEIEKAANVTSTALGEVELFLVSAKARGHGVGRLLWRAAMDYFARNSVTNCFLHTDSSCDMGFYDHQGFRRISEESLRKASPTLRDMARRDVIGVDHPHEKLFLCVGPTVRSV